MSCKDKHCHPYPIEPAPFAPGSCDPHPPCPPRPPRPPMPCAPCPPSQYVGSRYVPIFADPIEWDIHRSYESLTIVTHDGESYTSKCNVAPGVDITNTRYWAKTGAYNAQVEQYKNEVKDLSSQVTGFASDNAEFREKIDQFTKDNAEMKNTVAEDKARVDALAERVATAETEIDGLQATTAQHTTELANLHAKDEDLQRQITSNDNDIAALQAKDVEHDSRLNGIDTKLRSHDATLAQNTADIAKNTKNIQDNAVAIAQNAHELADHAEQLADHEARLTSQHQEITANHQAIERNTSNIASLRADLTEDEAKIESNRDAIAHIQEKDVQQDGRLDALENAHHYANIAAALKYHANIPCRVNNASYTLSGTTCTFERLVVNVQLENDATIADTSIPADETIGVSINYESADNKILNTAITLTKPSSVNFISAYSNLMLIFNNVPVHGEAVNISRIFNVFVSAK